MLFPFQSLTKGNSIEKSFPRKCKHFIGKSKSALIHLLAALPTHTPWTYVVFSEMLAAFIGLVAGVLPARHAALLDPIEALRAE